MQSIEQAHRHNYPWLLAALICVSFVSASFTTARADLSPDGEFIIGRKVIAYTGTDGALGPQFGSGVSFSELYGGAINESGDVLYNGYLAGQGVVLDNSKGLWFRSSTTTTPSIIARAGTTGILGPNYPDEPEATFNRNSLWYGWVNNLGQFTFRGHDGYSGGTWRSTGSANEAIALARNDGPLGPGLGPGVWFISTPSPDVYTDSGLLVFNGAVNQRDPVEGGQLGIWTVKDTEPNIVARTDTVGPYGPGLGDGREFITLGVLGAGPDDSIYIKTMMRDSVDLSESYALMSLAPGGE